MWWRPARESFAGHMSMEVYGRKPELLCAAGAGRAGEACAKGNYPGDDSAGRCAGLKAPAS